MRTPLAEAVEKGHMTIVEVLMKAGAVVDRKVKCSQSSVIVIVTVVVYRVYKTCCTVLKSCKCCLCISDLLLNPNVQSDPNPNPNLT